MAARGSGQGTRPERRAAPGLEALEGRALQAAGFGPHLGPFVATAPPGAPVATVRGLRPGRSVDPHRAINRELGPLLGAGMDRIERRVEIQDTSATGVLASKVLAQPFVHNVLARDDAYRLLDAPAVRAALAPETLATTTDQAQTVDLTLPESDLAGVGESSLVIVRPGDPAPGGGVFAEGFQVQVPGSAIAFLPGHLIRVTVPLSALPATAQASLAGTNPDPLPALFAATGPLLTEALRSGTAQTPPTGVPDVPGLRLADTLVQARTFPDAGRTPYFRMMRVAVDRDLLALDAPRADAIRKGVNAFLAVVNGWSTLAPAELARLAAAAPPGGLAPSLPSGPLGNTLAVTDGVIQPTTPGLPERIEVGYVFARNGDYGLILTARGPLSTTVGAATASGTLGGDVGAEVSDAPDLAHLQGWRVAEGLAHGGALLGTVSASSGNGTTTFGASAGYGAGLEYGLGVRYTQVVPLGNVAAGVSRRR